MVSYQPLWETLARRGMSKTSLSEASGITPSTMARLARNDNVSLITIEKICKTLNVEIEDVVTRDEQRPLSGTFRPNKNEPVHRWFPYLEGYSRQLVEYELRNRQAGEVVYDPFGGSGTTPLTAVMNGLDGLYSEINPVMSLIAQTKMKSTALAMDGELDLSRLRNWQERFRGLDVVGLKAHENRSLGDFDRFFDEDALLGIHVMREFIEEESDDLIRDLLKVVLASIVVPVSRMIRRGDLRFANDRERAKNVYPFKETAIAKFGELINDLSGVPRARPGYFAFVSEDVRDSDLRECVDVVVTSPPYLNGTNYFRNTKLEMRVLNIIESEKELGGFYQQGITAGINNVSSRREYETVEFPAFEEIVSALEADAYDSRIPVMVTGYFADMHKAISKIHEALKSGGVLSFDIGDSQFAGVHVPTHTLLDVMIREAGFEALDQTVLRTRRSRNGMTLTQRVMRYVKE